MKQNGIEGGGALMLMFQDVRLPVVKARLRLPLHLTDKAPISVFTTRPCSPPLG